jgi:hypothetical protein
VKESRLLSVLFRVMVVLRGVTWTLQGGDLHDVTSEMKLLFKSALQSVSGLPNALSFKSSDCDQEGARRRAEHHRTWEERAAARVSMVRKARMCCHDLPCLTVCCYV